MDLLQPNKNEIKRDNSVLSDDESPHASKKSKQGASSSFVPKLYEMVDANTNNLISWNLAGDSFIVANLSLFSSEILPTHFKHSNFSSFVRQLNMYGFHKCNKTPRGQKAHPEHQVWEFSHPNFLRGRKDLLEDIKRKVLDGAEASTSTSTAARSTDLPSSVALLQLSQSQSNQSIATLNQRVLFLEQQLEHSRGETQCLKDVVKQLYAFLYGTHGGLPFDYPWSGSGGGGDGMDTGSGAHTNATTGGNTNSHFPLKPTPPAQPPIFVTSPDTSTHATNAANSTIPPYPYSPSPSSAGSPIPDLYSTHSSPYASEYGGGFRMEQPLSPLSLGSSHYTPQAHSQRPMNLSVDTNFSLLGSNPSPSDSVGLVLLITLLDLISTAMVLQTSNSKLSFHERETDIEEHGVIGNCMTAALVSSNCTTAQLSMPYFDSPSIFARIVDVKKGGHWSIDPQTATVNKQMYLPSTNILNTKFLADDAVANVDDFMPLSSPTHLVRRVECLRGTMSFVSECAPAFNYARSGHSVRVDSGSNTAYFDCPDHINLDLRCTVGAPDAVSDPAVSLTSHNAAERGFLGDAVCIKFSLSEGQVVTLVLSEREDNSTSPTFASTEHLLESTTQYWLQWSAKMQYKGRWREQVLRSALSLKLLTFAPTGAVIAAPTFSLPEDLHGAGRNWDYRYAWLRDSSFTVYALVRLGFKEEANAYVDWIASLLEHPNSDGSLQIVYTIHGQREMPEIELPHLAGHRGQKPVRIGNGAADHLQLDVYGAVLDAVYLAQKHANPLSYDCWVGMRKLVDYVCDAWNQPDLSIWEVRSQKQNFLVMCWVAIDRGLRLADKRCLPCPNRLKWLENRDNIYEEIQEKGYNKQLGFFSQSYENRDVLDSSILIMPLTFFIAPTDPRLLSTLKHVLLSPEKGGLTSNNLVSRYDVTKANDGIGGEEGAFGLCTLWACEALCRAGAYDKKLLSQSVVMLEDFLGYTSNLGLLSEEIGKGGQALAMSCCKAYYHPAICNCQHHTEKVREMNQNRNGFISPQYQREFTTDWEEAQDVQELEEAKSAEKEWADIARAKAELQRREDEIAAKMSSNRSISSGSSGRSSKAMSSGIFSGVTSNTTNSNTKTHQQPQIIIQQVHSKAPVDTGGADGQLVYPRKPKAKPPRSERIRREKEEAAKRAQEKEREVALQEQFKRSAETREKSDSDALARLEMTASESAMREKREKDRRERGVDGNGDIDAIEVVQSDQPRYRSQSLMSDPFKQQQHQQLHKSKSSPAQQQDKMKAYPIPEPMMSMAFSDGISVPDNKATKHVSGWKKLFRK
ncbi:hypothetical protein E3P84_03205 [Wallemia ichthyophaga]|nr:hypothetical protein E3P84_03205 [Wallemia ichthyophaga]TIB40050.1 hypothetical protein E3P83_03141 [Wallemia ichthyophaga]